jgi:16S rRNA (cytosine1402-N4)-methyltransferase
VQDEGKKQKAPLSTNAVRIRSCTTGHQPVLLQEALLALNIQPSDVVVDATIGGGGHAKAVAQKLDNKGHLIGIDADSAAILRAREGLKSVAAKVTLVHANFRTLDGISREHGITAINKALFDLGWSSDQLMDSGRGFSFERDEPLLMTYNDAPSADALTAQEILNTWEEESIADILFGWGGERFSRRIASEIVAQRKEKKFETTFDLVQAIERATPSWYQRGKRHAATKTFQALRIAVNDELGALMEGLDGALAYLAPEGRIAVITFHSVEDRAVKRLFKQWSEEGRGSLPTKKPISPSRAEVVRNPRARSAKLRVFQKKS